MNTASNQTVYVFNRKDGRHLRTVNALTGATVYQFNYNGNVLTGIDNDGQVTTINGSEIAGPFGEKTTFGPDREGLWTSISNPASSMSFTGTKRDVVTSLTSWRRQAGRSGESDELKTS